MSVLDYGDIPNSLANKEAEEEEEEATEEAEGILF